jgi:hypothetical protein
MRKLIFTLILAVPAAAFAAGGTPAPTFSKDVAPIFNKACVECHRPTMFAPMSDDVRHGASWAKSVSSARSPA